LCGGVIAFAFLVVLPWLVELLLLCCGFGTVDRLLSLLGPEL
jgi:hypothetical protein